jgi:hypothetical protein
MQLQVKIQRKVSAGIVLLRPEIIENSIAMPYYMFRGKLGKAYRLQGFLLAEMRHRESTSINVLNCLIECGIVAEYALKWCKLRGKVEMGLIYWHYVEE